MAILEWMDKASEWIFDNLGGVWCLLLVLGLLAFVIGTVIECLR